MDQRPNCVQFFVNAETSSPLALQNTYGPFVLHLDEVDVTGICWAQLHCSLKPSVYKTPSDCDRLVSKAKLFFSNDAKVNLGKR